MRVRIDDGRGGHRLPGLVGVRWIPCRRAGGDSALVVGSEECVVVVTPGRYPLKRVRFGELEVEDPASCAIGCGRRCRMQGVPGVERQVARFRLEGNHWELVFVAPVVPVLDVPVEPASTNNWPLAGVAWSSWMPA